MEKTQRYRDQSEVIEDYRIFIEKVKKTIAGTTEKRAVLFHADLGKGKVGAYTYKSMEALGLIKQVEVQGTNHRFYKWICGEDDIDMELAKLVYEGQKQQERNAKGNRSKPEIKDVDSDESKVISGWIKDAAPIVKKETIIPKAVKTTVTIIRPLLNNEVFFLKEQLHLLEEILINRDLQVNGIVIKAMSHITFVPEEQGTLMCFYGGTNAEEIASAFIAEGITLEKVDKDLMILKF